MRALRANPGGLSTAELAKVLGLRKNQRSGMKALLLRMLHDGKVVRHRGRFLLRHGAAKRRSPRQQPRLFSEEPAKLRREAMAILCEDFSLTRDFPPLVQREARTAKPEDASGGVRADLTDLQILCVDPEDARDHDDGVSLEREGKGWRLGVHIADVSAYVREGTALDEEARRRGNSTYFLFDTIHMLPPRLASELCSLTEGEKRPALSAFLYLDAAGNVMRVQVMPSLVQISRSISYRDAERELRENAGPSAALLKQMDKLSMLLRRRRQEGGALAFELPETVPVLENEEVARFGRSEILRSHLIVEEFMLIANREIAALLISLGVSCLHRVHDDPSTEDVDELRQWLAGRGIRWAPKQRAGNRQYQALIGQISNHPDRERILYRLLRSLSKACYSDRPTGHFGLAWKEYLHFTSPIRRYPDLLTHRIIKRLLDGSAGSPVPMLERVPPEDPLRRRRGRGSKSKKLKDLAADLSETEQRSIKAEREALKLEMVLWCRRRMGESLAATIQGVFPNGVLIRLDESGVESFMPAHLLGSEYFIWHEECEELRGEHSGRRFREGQSLSVRIVNANPADRRVDFFLEPDGQEGEAGDRT